MKFNFGTGITIFYILFASFLALFVIKASGVEYSLVSKEYYAEDLAYQSHFEKIENRIQQNATIKISQDKNTEEIVLTFPENLKKGTGNITFYRSSDANQDWKQAVKLNQKGEQVISTASLSKGSWEIKIDWQANGYTFFQEEILYL